MRSVKRHHLTLGDLGHLLGLDAHGVRDLLAREPLLRVRQVGGRPVVSVAAWRRWVADVNESALRSLPLSEDRAGRLGRSQ